MYCGSCLHDCRLTAALRAQGRDAVLVPLYTPVRTDETDPSTPHVYYGGINVYLQQASALFRHTPWLLDRLFDAPALLRAVGRLAARTGPAELGKLTAAVLAGERGPQRKELEKLVVGLRQLRPDLIYLPNLMFVGLARRLKAALHVPLLCGLTGEDIFLDRLPPPYRAQVFDMIRAAAAGIDGFIALTDYYAHHAAVHFGLPVDRIHRIPLGIQTADFAPAAGPPERPFTIGYLASALPKASLSWLTPFAYCAAPVVTAGCVRRAISAARTGHTWSASAPNWARKTWTSNIGVK
jgi:glycosyltransferase involved in cell wall biosynthesis